jgi:DNA mismatch repair protein MutS2
LDDDVLAMAREYMQEDVVRLEDVIAEMEVASQTARMEAQRASAERALSERLRAEYENKLASLERERKKIINDAKREAKAVLMRARAEFERSLDEIRQAQSKTSAEVNARASEIRGRLREAQGDMVLDEEDDVPGEPVTPDELEPGLQVRVIGFSEPAIVLESPTSLDRVLVQVGDFKLRVDIGQLRSVDSLGRRKRMSAPRVDLVSSGESKPISSEIDLRGMTKEEAWAVLDKYLDDAFMASLPQVRIIHGKGTGVLRKAVEEYLDASTKYVDSYRIGEPSEGGTGVTVVKLKR